MSEVLLVASLRRRLCFDDNVPTSHQVPELPRPRSDCVSGAISTELRPYTDTSGHFT